MRNILTYKNTKTLLWNSKCIDFDVGMIKAIRLVFNNIYI